MQPNMIQNKAGGRWGWGGFVFSVNQIDDEVKLHHDSEYAEALQLLTTFPTGNLPGAWLPFEFFVGGTECL